MQQLQLDLFETLDKVDNVGEIFKLKCKNFTKIELLTLRDKRVGNEGRTLLHNAARIGSIGVVLHLLRLGHGIDPIDSTLSRITPLMDAVTYLHYDVVMILVESGAKINLEDINGENVLHYAARTGSVRMIKSILKISGISQNEIKLLCSVANVRRKFPEDLAKNLSCKESLESFRNFGFHNIIKPTKDKKKINSGS